MKNKLPEKLTAILLVFAMAFLTVPFVKAEVIISLEENEEIGDTGFAVANAGQTRGTYNISYWYSQSISIGYWETPPTVYYCRMSGTSYFDTAMVNGAVKWRNVLGVNIASQSTSDAEIDHLNYNDIQFYQGSNSQLKQLSFFENNDINDTSVYGLTQIDVPRYNASPERVHTLILNGEQHNGYRYWLVRGYIKDFGSNTTKYNFVCTHEIGHALGWSGHSNNSSDVMYPYYNGVTALTDRDKFHLRQYYDIFY